MILRIPKTNVHAGHKALLSRFSFAKNTVIQDSDSGKRVVYKQINLKPVLIKSNPVKQIYCIHVVYSGYTAASVIRYN